MPEPAEPIDGVSVTTYVFDAFLPEFAVHGRLSPSQLTGVEAITAYLWSLMAMQDFRVVSEVRTELVEPEGPVTYPPGFVVLRAMVDVQEWDVEVELVDEA